MFKIFFTKKSEKELSKISKIDAKRVMERLLKLDYPFPQNFDIDKMEGTKNFYRLRVGQTRTFVELDIPKKEIWIRKVRYRGSAYKF